MIASADLTLSPFAVLDVGMRDTKERVVHAEEERSFDEGADESLLGQARTVLTLGNQRLHAELSWLPELAPNRARELVARLREPNANRPADLLQGIGGLSRVNLTANLLAKAPTDRQLRKALIEAHGDLDISQARTAIEEARRISGFPSVGDLAWSEGLQRLREGHARIMVDALASDDDGPRELARWIEDGSLEAPPVGDFRDALISSYEHWSAPLLTRTDEQIDACIDDLGNNPASAASVSRLCELLDDWDRISQPVQLHEQSQGLDERRSMAVFRKVRDLAISLWNKHQQLDSALKLSRTLHRVFPELPSALSMIRGDLETLEGLEGRHRDAEILGPLANAVEAAEVDPKTLAAEVNAHGFGRRATGVARALYTAFQEASSRASELESRHLPWVMVRSVAILMNNQAERPVAALTIVNVLLQTAEGEIKQRLLDDHATLTAVALDVELKKAIEGRYWGKACEILEKLIAMNTADRVYYVQLKASIEADQKSSNAGWLGRLILFGGLLIGGAALFDARPKSDYTAPASADLGNDVMPDYGETDLDLSVPSGEPVTPPVVEPVNYASQEETAPPAYPGRLLTRAEIRYCQFESARLTELKGMNVPNSAIQKFNGRVDDYNRLCGYYRYEPSDLAAIQSELLGAGDRLRAQARSVLVEWQGSGFKPTFAPTPISTIPYSGSETSSSSNSPVEGAGPDYLENSVGDELDSEGRSLDPDQREDASNV